MGIENIIDVRISKPIESIAVVDENTAFRDAIDYVLDYCGFNNKRAYFSNAYEIGDHKADLWLIDIMNRQWLDSFHIAQKNSPDAKIMLMSDSANLYNSAHKGSSGLTIADKGGKIYGLVIELVTKK
jgi:hypothetical protein